MAHVDHYKWREECGPCEKVTRERCYKSKEEKVKSAKTVREGMIGKI